MNEAGPAAQTDDRGAWLDQIARAVRPYLGSAPKPDGAWIRLDQHDGTAMSVRARDWDEIERRAREMN